jgi:NitT/TauT family transport system substrate-binding protein
MNYDHVQAWKGEQLDAILTYEPALTQLQAEEGLVRLFDSHSAPQLIIDVLAVRSEKLMQHEMAIRELIAGHFRALEMWYVNPIDTAYRLSTSLGIPPEQVKLLFKGLDMPDVLYNLQYLTPPSEQLQYSARVITEIFTRHGLMKQHFVGENLFTADYLPEVRG